MSNYYNSNHGMDTIWRYQGRSGLKVIVSCLDVNNNDISVFINIHQIMILLDVFCICCIIHSCSTSSGKISSRVPC